MLHPAITLLAIVATANHYWLDAAVAGVLVVAAAALLSARRERQTAVTLPAIAISQPSWASTVATSWAGSLAANDPMLATAAISATGFEVPTSRNAWPNPDHVPAITDHDPAPLACCAAQIQ
jgi:hypothetical protein